MTRYQLTRVSSNRKTGPIPVSTTSADTCPPSCPLRGSGCYAESGNLAIHWRQVTNGKRGTDFPQFLREVRALPRAALWRHNQSGDLPGKLERINRTDLIRLAKANKGKRGFTYTHKPPTPANLEAIREANAIGFTVNLSANNPAHADLLARTGLPVVTVLPIDAPTLSKTPEGRPILSCPATRKDTTTCANCGICQIQNRKFIVGFPAHGPKRIAEAVTQSWTYRARKGKEPAANAAQPTT